MAVMQEFKEFALKGNVMDLAVGVIIGGAFGKIVDSIVGDLIMPIVSKLFGGLDFSATTSLWRGRLRDCHWRKPKRLARCWPMATSSPSP